MFSLWNVFPLPPACLLLMSMMYLSMTSGMPRVRLVPRHMYEQRVLAAGSDAKDPIGA